MCSHFPKLLGKSSHWRQGLLLRALDVRLAHAKCLTGTLWVELQHMPSYGINYRNFSFCHRKNVPLMAAASLVFVSEPTWQTSNQIYMMLSAFSWLTAGLACCEAIAHWQYGVLGMQLKSLHSQDLANCGTCKSLHYHYSKAKLHWKEPPKVYLKRHIYRWFALGKLSHLWKGLHVSSLEHLLRAYHAS